MPNSDHILKSSKKCSLSCMIGHWKLSPGWMTIDDIVDLSNTILFTGKLCVILSNVSSYLSYPWIEILYLYFDCICFLIIVQ